MAAGITGLARLLLAALALTLLAAAGAAGAPRWLAPQTLSPPNSADTAPRVAIDGSGNAIAAWTTTAGGLARQVAVADRPAGSETWSEPTTISVPAFVQLTEVAWAGDGAAVVTWSSAPTFGPIDRAVVQVAVRPRGSATFGPPQDLSLAGAHGVSPRLAEDGRGTVIAAWEDRSGGRPGANSPGTVMVAVRPPAADAFGPAEALSEPLAGSPPDVAVNAAGDAMIVWSTGTAPRTVLARSRRAGAGAWEPAAAVSPAGTDAAAARVGIDAAGAAVAAWIASGYSGSTLQAAARPADGAWTAPEDLGQVVAFEPPTLVMEPDGTATAVFLRPGGPTRLAARVRPAGGAWSAIQHLSHQRTALDLPPPSTGDRAASGARGGVLAYWTGSSAPLRPAPLLTALKPAGAARFEPAVAITAPGQGGRMPQAALGADGEAAAVWTSFGPPTPLGGIVASRLTSGPGTALEPPAVQATGIGAPARAGAGTLARLTASFAAPDGLVTVTAQRLGSGGFADDGPAVTVWSANASVPVRLRPGPNVLRIAYLDRGAVAYTESVTVIGTRPGRPLTAAGPRPIAVAVGFGWVWTLTVDGEGEGSVLRIDPRTRRVAGEPIPVGRASGLVLGSGAVWVAGAPGEIPGLQRIDPAALAVTARFPLAITGSVAVGAGGVWAIECGRRGAISNYTGDCGEQRLVMVDPATNAVTPVVDVVATGATGYPLASGLGAGAGRVWFTIAGEEGSVVASYGLAAHRLDRGLTGSAVHAPFAASGRTLWAGSGACGLARVIQGRKPATVLKELPGADRYSCGVGMAAGPRDVWVGQATPAAPGMRGAPAVPTRIVRVDARTGRVIGRPITLGRGPVVFAVGAGAVWAAYADAGVVARIDPGPAARARPSAARPRPIALVRTAWGGRQTLSARGLDATAPDVAAGPRGRAAAVWLRPLDGQLTAIESAVRPTGARWRSARALDRTAGVGAEERPRVAMAPGGEAVAIWSSRGDTAPAGHVRTSVLATGARVWAAPEDRSAEIDPGAAGPTVATAADGGTAALWSEGATLRVSARPTAGAFGAPVEVAPAAIGPFAETGLALAPGGAGVVIWATGVGPVLPGVWVAERAPDGAWGAPIALARLDTLVRGITRPRIAVNASGDALAAWNGGGGVIVTRRPAGGSWSAPAPLDAVSTRAEGSPEVALDDAGNAVIVVRGFDLLTANFRIQAFSRPAAGGGWDGPLPLSPAGPLAGAPGPDADQPSLALDGRGRAVVVWVQRVNGALQVLGRRRPAAGGQWGPLEAVSAPARGASAPRVALDAAGGAVAVWLERASPLPNGAAGDMQVRSATRTGGAS